jgi:hypothetical protein
VAAATSPFISSIDPDSGPVAGGTVVTIRGSGFTTDSCGPIDPSRCLLQTVYFGSQRAAMVQFLDDTRIVVTTPAHLPSATEVVVTGHGWTISKKNAYTFTGDPTSAFARILIPILVPPVQGQFGSQFVTELRARSFQIDPSLYMFGIPYCDCPQRTVLADDPYPVYGTSGLNGFPSTDLIPSDTMNGAPGRIVFVEAASASKLSMNLRVHDTSRIGITLGAEVPVVPDSAFKSTPFVLLGVAADARYRNTLRIYSPEPGVAPVVRVTIDQSPQSVTLRPGRDMFDPGYFEMTLPPRFQSGSTINTIPVTIEPLTTGARVWAFISSTNNDTQQVTVIAPRP